MEKRVAIAALVALGWTAPTAAAPSAQKDARVRTVFSHTLPAIDGSHMAVTTVEVTYPPGGSAAAHSHPCPVIGYVLKGAVRMQVEGGSTSVYRTGSSFYEAANQVHLVSQNASTQQPAAFLAYFICDHAGPLSVNVPAKGEGQP